MATAPLSLTCVSTALSKRVSLPSSNELAQTTSASPCDSSIPCTKEESFNAETDSKRRLFLLGIGAVTTSLLPASPLFAQEIPQNYQAFVDVKDGYSYVYPSDWRDFDFRAHDSAFKDRYLQLQNVRVRFIPTDKKDIREMGPIEEVVFDLVKHVYAAPNQRPTIFDMQERTVDGKNYYTFEYELTSPHYSSVSFATIAVGNGRYYTLVVGANERRWRRVRNKLKVVADSFKVLDI